MIEKFDPSLAIEHLQLILKNPSDKFSENDLSDIRFVLSFLSNSDRWAELYQTHTSALLGNSNYETWLLRATNHYNKLVVKLLTNKS